LRFWATATQSVAASATVIATRAQVIVLTQSS
jgi:hypothetical protein